MYSKWHYSLYVAKGVLWICSSSHSPLLLDHRNASPPTRSLRASVTVAAVSPLRTPNSVRARVTTIPPGSCSSRVMMSSKKYAFSLPLPLPRTGTGNTHRGHRTQRMSDLNCPTKNLYQNHVNQSFHFFQYSQRASRGHFYRWVHSFFIFNRFNYENTTTKIVP